jgi:hypothetical protein
MYHFYNAENGQKDLQGGYILHRKSPYSQPALFRRKYSSRLPNATQPTITG